MNNILYNKRMHLVSDAELNEIQEALDKEKLICFYKNIKIYNLLELIYQFFVNKNPTYFINNKLQTPKGRSRSLIDFYLIQKYYLKNPLTLIDCKYIYFKLPRVLFMTKNNGFNSITNYFCNTVRRNVFRNTSFYNLDIFAESIKNCNGVNNYSKIIKNKAIKENFKSDVKFIPEKIIHYKVKLIGANIYHYRTNQIYNLTYIKNSNFIIIDNMIFHKNMLNKKIDNLFNSSTFILIENEKI